MPRAADSIENYFKSGTFLVELRAWAIAGIAGALFGAITSSFAAQNDVVAVVPVNENGFAQPMIGLVGALEDDDKETNVTFEPEELQEIYVCEYSYLKGDSGRDVLLTYLDRYASCLSTNRLSENSFVVRANRFSNDLKQSDSGQYFCKCPQVP